MNFFSKRTAHWSDHQNLLTKTVSEKRSRGACVFDLTESNPTQCGFLPADREILEGLSDKDNSFYEPDPRGLAAARKCVSDYYLQKGIFVDPANIFLTSSTSEAYSFLFKLLADPGDAVLAPRPGYPLFDFFGDLHDINIHPYPLCHEASGWRIQEAALTKAFSVKPRGLMVIHPNNPTGNYLRREQKLFVENLCVLNQTALVCDEVFYDYFVESMADVESCAGDSKVLTFTLSGISKILCLPQMKCAWIVVSGPCDLVREAIKRLEIIADTYLSVGTPVQRALPGWMSFRRCIQQNVLDRIKINEGVLSEVFKGHEELRILKRQGGWYAVLKIASDGPLAARFDDESLVIELLQKMDVLIYPGYFFDFADGHYWVVSLIVRPETFRKAAERIAEFIRGI